MQVFIHDFFFLVVVVVLFRSALRTRSTQTEPLSHARRPSSSSAMPSLLPPSATSTLAISLKSTQSPRLESRPSSSTSRRTKTYLAPVCHVFMSWSWCVPTVFFFRPTRVSGMSSASNATATNSHSLAHRRGSVSMVPRVVEFYSGLGGMVR